MRTALYLLSLAYALVLVCLIVGTLVAPEDTAGLAHFMLSVMMEWSIVPALGLLLGYHRTGGEWVAAGAGALALLYGATLHAIGTCTSLGSVFAAVPGCTPADAGALLALLNVGYAPSWLIACGAVVYLAVRWWGATRVRRTPLALWIPALVLVWWPLGYAIWAYPAYAQHIAELQALYQLAEQPIGQ